MIKRAAPDGQPSEFEAAVAGAPAGQPTATEVATPATPKRRRTTKAATATTATAATEAATAVPDAASPAGAAVAPEAATPAKPKRRRTAKAPAEPTGGPTIGLPSRTAAVPFESDRRWMDIARRIVELAEDKKAADIVLLEIGALTTLADAFVICSGGSERQLDAIAQGIIDGLRDEGVRPIGREGIPASHWILLDFGGVIVHLFTPPERDFYQLEKHWSEARIVLQVQ